MSQYVELDIPWVPVDPGGDMCIVRITLVLATAFASAHVFAQGTTPDAVKHASPDTHPDVAAPAMRIYIDPATGERRSTPTEAQRAALAINPMNARYKSHGMLIEKRLPSGAISLWRPGGFMSVAKIHVDADGSRTITCNDATHAHAHPHAAGHAPAPAVPTRKTR